MQTQSIEETRKKIFSIIKSLEPIELKSLENYVEFLAHRNNESKFVDILRNAKPEDETLSQSEIEGIKESDKNIEKGRIRELKDYAIERGLI
ncbi:MAG: hypothetical protein ABR980_13700 [Ignavibacteriaceae bacterium]|jgi:hypothetical protein